MAERGKLDNTMKVVNVFIECDCKCRTKRKRCPLSVTRRDKEYYSQFSSTYIDLLFDREGNNRSISQNLTKVHLSH